MDLFKISGHWQKYREDMFPMMAESEEASAAEQGFVMKPMNCPFHIQIYKSELRSYRDLPLRYAEFGTVYRYEQSGELGGLTRVRGFTVDDAHLFVRPDQLEEEFLKVVDLILVVFDKLKLKDFRARLSFRDPKSDKYLGSPEEWDMAENAIRRAVEKLSMPHFEGIGEAAFYGPKLDFIFRDALDREWQLGTVQVDYQNPQRFDLYYVAEDGSRQRPVMIHRAPFGSLERLIGILIEEYAGDFPFWLAPEQVRILPVSDQYLGYATQVRDQLREQGIRVHIDADSDRLPKKIRNAEKAKVPFMLIVGEKEQATGTVSVRQRHGQDLGSLTVADFLDQVQALN